MIKLKQLLLEKTLYHGTTIDNVDSILRYGLLPDVGGFTSDMYGDYEEDAGGIPELTFATDKENLDKAVTAATHHIAKKLNKGFHDVTDAEFIKYAAIVKIFDGEGSFNKKLESDDYKGIEHPYSVEPNDYYSEDTVGVDEVITGNSLIRLLKRNGLYPRTYGKDVLEKTINQKRDFLVKLALKAYSDKFKDKNDIINKVKSLSSKDVEYNYNKHAKKL